MTRPSDGPFDLIDEEAYQRAASALKALEREDLDYVLGGGWAVFAHEPSVPSVDVDLYLHRGQGDAARQALKETELNIGQGGEVEFLSIEGEVELWGSYTGPGQGATPMRLAWVAWMAPVS